MAEGNDGESVQIAPEFQFFHLLCLRGINLQYIYSTLVLKKRRDCWKELILDGTFFI